MPYATATDITDRYGDNALLVAADRDGDDVVDLAAVTRALVDATAEIDGYLAVKYPLPLPVVPDVLVRCCVDIGLYRLSPESAYTEEKRQRYEDAIAYLRDVARGITALPLPDGALPESSVGGAELIGPERQFSRRTMGRLT